MNAPIDLKQLAGDRREPAPTQAPSVRRRTPVFTRYVIPAGVLAGFVGLIGWGTRDQWLPNKPVTVIPVVVARAEAAASAGTPLFQAAGWIEPRPSLIAVTSLTEGIIAELLVVDGQEVTVGDPVARLIDADAKLSLKQAEADLRLQRAELEAAKSEAIAARARLDKPLHLEIEQAEAESRLAASEGQLSAWPTRVAAAEAKLHSAEATRAARKAGGDAIAGRLLRDAEAETAGAQADLDGLQASKPRLLQEVEALKQKVALLRDQRKSLVEESRRSRDAAAAVEAAEARVQQAELAVESANLIVSRTVVRAPASGRVLRMMATPGSRVGGRLGVPGQEGSYIATMYNPASLQVRADVRLEDVPRITSGAPARIETASAGKPIDGRVLLATGEANVQKNTLAVKVELVDPPATVRPEMLVQVTFLAPETKASQAQEQAPPERMLIPPTLAESEGASASVWLAGVDGRAHKQSVTLGAATSNGLIEVMGLRPTDKLIAGGREGLSEGDRIKVTGEADAP